MGYAQTKRLPAALLSRFLLLLLQIVGEQEEGRVRQIREAGGASQMRADLIGRRDADGRPALRQQTGQERRLGGVSRGRGLCGPPLLLLLRCVFAAVLGCAEEQHHG